MPRSFRPDVSFALPMVALAGCLLFGCASSSGEPAAAPGAKTAKRTEKSECTALIDLINSGVERVEKMQTPGASGSAADDLVAMAKATDELAAAAARLNIESPELARMSADYQTMARRVAQAAREMAAAVKARDEGAFEDAHHAIVKAMAAEDPLVDSINRYCTTGEVTPRREPPESPPEENPQT